MTAEIFDDYQCVLGEGLLWHPLRSELFWFDIKGKSLFAKRDGERRAWQFDEHVSAAGWVDENRLLMASETSLSVFDIETGKQSKVVALEEDNLVTRSNDGRADPFGGFWIGTMGKSAEKKAGAIYRLFKGELRQLYADVTISNAICFSPDGEAAYFTDTTTGKILRVHLDDRGWPAGEPFEYLDFSGEEFGPDGAVVDADGNFWNAQWGIGRVACYGPDGTFLSAHQVPTPQSTCPCFDDQGNLYVTTAADGLTGDELAGKTFVINANARGQQEHQVLL